LRLGIVLLLAGQFFLSWSWVHADEMICPPHLPVSIDIKPGSHPNSINLSSRGVVAVAVLTTPGVFDASQFTPEMAHLIDTTTGVPDGCAGAQAVRWAREDVNRDRRLDLVFFFDVQSLNLTSSTTQATFMAHGFDGLTMSDLHIMGTDTVMIKQ
jgi:hypothetical protein